jgi:hypothetical protein
MRRNKAQKQLKIKKKTRESADVILQTQKLQTALTELAI